MNKRLYEVGQRVDKWCVVCSEDRGHVVASVSVKGHVTRVTCPICGTRGSFKNGANSPLRARRVKRRNRTTGLTPTVLRQLINHPSYGLGEVVALIEPKKMDVLFADRIRRLVHSRV